MPHVQATSLQNAPAPLDFAIRQILTDFDTHTPLPRIFADLERTLYALASWFADTLFASFLFSLLEHTDLEHRVIAAKKAHTPAWKLTRRREVTLTLLGGHLVSLRVCAGRCERRRGRIEELIATCLELARGRRAKEIKSLTNYFSEHQERMRYAAFEEMKVSLGSGAVESKIRQVINLRLKGCGKFWKRARAERMLLLRSFLVTGRFDDLFDFALGHRVAWWNHSLREDSCASQEVDI